MSRPKGKSSGENATFPILEQYLRYMQAVQEKSPLTIKEYKYDLILLFRFLKMDRGAGEQRVQKQRQQPQRTAQPVPLREKGEMLCERQNKADLDQLRGLHRQSSGQYEPRGVVSPVHAHAEDKDRRSQQRCGSCGKVPLPDQPAVVRQTK